MALEAQTRPKRSPERAPTEGERILEEQEANSGTGQRRDPEEDNDQGPGYEDEAPRTRTPARREASDGLDEAGAAASAVEKRARKLGWRPESEWKGDPAKWVDAAEWIEKVLSNRPLAEDKFAKLEEQNNLLAAQVTESNKRLNEVGQVVLDMHKQSKTMRQREYDRARDDILAQQRAAVAEGDVPAYDAAKAREAELLKDKEADEAPVREEAAASTTAPNPVVTKWLASNPWFNSDRFLHSVADAYHLHLRDSEPTLSLGENLARVRAEMVRMYPEKFPGEEGDGEEDEPPRRASAVNRPTNNAARRLKGVAGRGIKDLPADDLAAFRRQQRTIPGFTEAEFLANYIWEDQDQRR